MPWIQSLFYALSFGIGFLLAWLWAASRLRLRYEQRQREIESASAAQKGVAEELRQQIERLREDLGASRAKAEQEQAKRVAAETDLANQRANLEERRRLLDEAEQKMKDAFQALASQTLETSTRQFLDLAGAKFEALQKEATGDLGKREEAIKGLVHPLSETLKKLEDKLSEEQTSRAHAYGDLAAQVRKLAETSEDLRKETGSLVTSLRQPQIKGKWGELLLRRALELTGMSPFCDFVEQPTTENEDGRLRPDLIVKLPGGGIVVIDAKVPQGAFLNALSARNQDEYWAAMSEHARLVRNHVGQLASRRYWEQFPQSPEFVVLFLPAESFFSAALEQDRTLIEDAMDKRIVLASPTTLLALLRTVAHGWHQERVAEHALEISALGKELYERITTFLEHMEGIRVGLEKANKSYNAAVGSLESRVLPSARKLKEKGVQATAEISAAEPTESALRPLAGTSADIEGESSPPEPA